MSISGCFASRKATTARRSTCLPALLTSPPVPIFRIPFPTLYYWRARARVAGSDISGALADISNRRFSGQRDGADEALPSDGFRVNAEISLNKIFDEYVQTGMRAWMDRKSIALAKRMFEVSEQHRTASFRELLRTQQPLPAEYLGGALRISKVADRITSILHRSRRPPPRDCACCKLKRDWGLRRRSRRARESRKFNGVNPGDALISFHTGQERSFVWAITPRFLRAARSSGAEDHRASCETLPRFHREGLLAGRLQHSALFHALRSAEFGNPNPKPVGCCRSTRACMTFPTPRSGLRRLP